MFRREVLQRFDYLFAKIRPPNFTGSLRSGVTSCLKTPSGITKKGNGPCRPFYLVALLVEFELERYGCTVIQVDGVSVRVAGSQVAGGENELPARGARAV